MGKAETISSRNGQVDEKLRKPFTLGWTREVVKRVVAKNPTCDIYYFSPDGKKLRSLREVKAHMTDRLTPDCFSFKREILGLGVNFETVRDANSKRKTGQKKGREIQTEPQPDISDIKRKKTEIENADLEEEDKESATENVENTDKPKIEDDTQREADEEASNKNLASEKKRRNVLAKVSHSDGKRETSKRAMSKEIEQSRVSPRKKPLQEAVKKVDATNNEITENTNKKGTKLEVKSETILRSAKQVTSASAETETKSKNGTLLKSKETPVQSTETEMKGKRNKRDLKRNEIPVQSTNTEAESEPEKVEEEQELGNADLKSIVQKNIGKYRKLREKQKLKLIRTEMKKNRARVVNNSRAESFLKNRSNYLKPLQKGWKRELVYRSNCSKAGLQADVYYFHPSGKKFRSSREILENPEIIGGLPIEFFTFRKEAIGCGEPLEVIRKARIPQKH